MLAKRISRGGGGRRFPFLPPVPPKGVEMSTFIRVTTAVAVLMLTAFGAIVLSDMSSAVDVDDSSSEIQNEAQIGQTQYATLEAAVQASQGETEITLLSDVTVSSSITIDDGKHITIDLSGHILNLDAVYALIVEGEDAYLQITNSSDSGKLFGTAADNDYNVAVNHGTFELQDVLFESKTLWSGGGCIMIVITGSETDQGEDYSKVIVGPGAEMLYTGTITNPEFGVDGIYIQNCKEKVSDDETRQLDMSYGAVVDFAGKFSAGEGIQVNTGINVQGNIKQTEGSIPKVIVHEGAVINGQAGLGIYGAGYAQYSIEGGKISGVTGVEVRAGTFTMSGGEIIGTGTSTVTAPNSSGWTTTGAGLAIAQHTSKLPISVIIEDGTIEGCTAVKQSNPQNNDAESISLMNMSIEGGTFTSTSQDPEAVVISSENFSGFITGGTFEGEVDESLLGDGMTVDDSGSVVPDPQKVFDITPDEFFDLAEEGPDGTLVFDLDRNYHITDSSGRLHFDGMDDQSYTAIVINGNGNTLYGSLYFDPKYDAGDSETYSVTINDLNLDGSKSTKPEWNYGISIQNQSPASPDSSARVIDFMMNGGSVSNYGSKGIYITTVSSVTIEGVEVSNCATDPHYSDEASGAFNFYTRGDYAIDIDITGIDGATIDIIDVTFSGNTGAVATLKIAQRGGAGDDPSKWGEATITGVTLDGLDFTDSQAPTDIILGSEPSTPSSDPTEDELRDYNSAFPVDLIAQGETSLSVWGADRQPGNGNNLRLDLTDGSHVKAAGQKDEENGSISIELVSGSARVSGELLPSMHLTADADALTFGDFEDLSGGNLELIEPEPFPPIWDDDDEYVPPIVPAQPEDSGNDTTTIVACAAAAVVAALMAAFLILDRRH